MVGELEVVGLVVVWMVEGGRGGGGRLFDQRSNSLWYTLLARFRSSNLRDNLLIS